MARVMRSSGSWVTDDATYKLIATGGVIMPIDSPNDNDQPEVDRVDAQLQHQRQQHRGQNDQSAGRSINTPVSRTTATTSSIIT